MKINMIDLLYHNASYMVYVAADLVFAFHQSSILLSALKLCKGKHSELIVIISLTVLLLSDDLLVPLMTLNVKNNRSNFPLEEGRENKSSASSKTFDHSDAVGALKRCHQTH